MKTIAFNRSRYTMASVALLALGLVGVYLYRRNGSISLSGLMDLFRRNQVADHLGTTSGRTSAQIYGGSADASTRLGEFDIDHNPAI